MLLIKMSKKKEIEKELVAKKVMKEKKKMKATGEEYLTEAEALSKYK